MIIQLFVTQAFGAIGGTAEYNRHLIRALADMPETTEIRVLTCELTHKDYSLPPKVKFDAGGAQGNYQFYKHALGTLQHSKPNLIICGHISLLTICSLLSKIFKVPQLLQMHGIEVWQPSRRNFLKNACAKRSKNRFSVSRTTLDRFQQWAGQPDGARSWILPNTFNCDQFAAGDKPEKLLTRYDLHDRWVILTFGRLVSEWRAKGFDAVLNALPTIVQSIPNAVYVIAGDGPDANRLREKAIRLGVDANVRFIGRVSEEEKKDHFLMADVFAMPSKGEGFGIVLLESLACGIPVIGSKCDGTKDALFDGKLGQIVDPDSISEVTSAVCNVHAANLPKTIPVELSEYSYKNFAAKVRDAILAVTAN